MSLIPDGMLEELEDVEEQNKQYPCSFSVTGTLTLVSVERPNKVKDRSELKGELTVASAGKKNLMSRGDMPLRSGRKKSHSSESEQSTSSKRRMSGAGQADLLRVTGYATSDEVLTNWKFMKKPSWILPRETLYDLPDSELHLLDRALEIGGPLTCQNSMIIITHLLLVQAVHLLHLHTKREQLPYVVQFKSKESQVITSPGPKPKLGDDSRGHSV